MTRQRGWQFWIDRGGTFTDVIARAPDGRLSVGKLLSDDPRRGLDAGVAAIRAQLAAHPGARIDAIRIGTTVATNALLERRGVPTALLVTAGFGDALQIGSQDRPQLFARDISLPAPLYQAVLEVTERVGAEGQVLVPLDAAGLEAGLRRLRADGIASLAIVFLHGYRHPFHERQAADLARAAGFDEVTTSHEASPLIRLVSRGDTTLVDAYLSPLLARYARQFRADLGPGHDATSIEFMQSHGGLVAPQGLRAANAILSGPAGGLIGLQRAAEGLGRTRLIAFDMGGTSTDVALYDGGYTQRHETRIAGVRLQAPMLNIHTVAAGGGSVLRFADGRLQVGPQSAGADPGPACYRAGGPLTVTDVNLLLGRLQADSFPAIFGPRRDQAPDADGVRRQFESLAAEVGAATGRPLSAEVLAAGFLDVAVESMAHAIRHVSVRQGHDPGDFALFCYGGAGGQHACRVADALGIREVLVHPLASVLSAWGIGLADRRLQRRRSLEQPLAANTLPALEQALAGLGEALRSEMAGHGVDPASIRISQQVELRLAGSESAIAVDAGGHEAMCAQFAAAFRQRYGFEAGTDRLVVATLRVEAVAAGDAAAAATPLASTSAGSGLAPCRAWFGGWREVPRWSRADLQPGTPVEGPALIVEANATTVVEPGWQASVLADGSLRLGRAVATAARSRVPANEPDPARLEIFNHRFMQVAEQMGAVLQATAVSVNIRERLDFSCALFDAHGALIANAPHMPVHLGSMGASVREVMRRNAGRMQPGDAWMLNDPYSGGTHLPDITVVSPVFTPGAPAPAWYVASRAHHADIGGMTPGSMPPDSRALAEEGILFDNFPLLQDGKLAERELRERLAADPRPARNPDQNVADLKAQLAANARGAQELLRLVAGCGRGEVDAYMGHVQDNAEACVRAAIGGLHDGAYRVPLDDGAEIRVAIRIDAARRSARIDFSGSSPQSAGNFNAPLAITTAAVLYVFRTLVDDDIPLNEGCLRPLELKVPAGSILNPLPPAAVVAGNVETSQLVVDALYGALGLLAAAQGTMNNLTFGDPGRQYYETIAGGAGASASADGASGVQTHMTNSRLTDPEVLESRFPVRLRAFHYRRGSGGAGRHRGGDGLVRHIEFLEPMTAAILSSRRQHAPFGLHGGHPGAVGRNWLLHANGEREALAGCAAVSVEPGDALLIETPGGGGYGPPD